MKLAVTMVEKYRPVWEEFFHDADVNGDDKLSWRELCDVFAKYGFKGDEESIRVGHSY